MLAYILAHFYFVYLATLSARPMQRLCYCYMKNEPILPVSNVARSRDTNMEFTWRDIDWSEHKL